MTVANVWINVENPPTQEQVIEQALKSTQYSYYPKEIAVKLIKADIKKSKVKLAKNELPSETKKQTRRTNKKSTK